MEKVRTQDINLIVLPVFLAILLQLNGHTSFLLLDHQHPALVLFVQNILFLNTLHILITFYHVLKYRNFQNALTYAVGSTQKTLYSCLAILLTVAGVYLFSKPHLQIFPWTLVGFTFFAQYHSVKQIRGISLDYVQKFSAIKNEKVLFNLFIFILLVLGLNTQLQIMSVQVGQGLALIVLGVILIQNIIYKNLIRCFFLLRLSLYPFVFTSVFCSLLVPCLHGIEYLIYFQKISAASSKAATRMSLFKYGLLVLITGILAAPFWPLLYGIFTIDQSFFMTVFYGVNFGLSFMHYYLDAKIFKFSIPQIRSSILGR